MAMLHISPEALSDLVKIKEYITTDLDNPTAALNVVSKITKAIRGLEQFPDIGAPLSSIIDMPTDYRFLVTGNYLSFYRHDGDAVYVVRVLYGKRDYLKILFGELPEQDSEIVTSIDTFDKRDELTQMRTKLEYAEQSRLVEEPTYSLEESKARLEKSHERKEIL
jgi:Plasmid stabilization system protein